jgi:hypothetical protein
LVTNIKLEVGDVKAPRSEWDKKVIGGIWFGLVDFVEEYDGAGAGLGAQLVCIASCAAGVERTPKDTGPHIPGSIVNLKPGLGISKALHRVEIPQ